MTEINPEDIQILHFDKDDGGKEQWNLWIECKSKEDYEFKKQSILSNQEKAKKYDGRLRGLPIPEECRQLNELTIHEYYLLVDEQNKKLEQEIEQLKEYNSNNVEIAKETIELYKKSELKLQSKNQQLEQKIQKIKDEINNYINIDLCAGGIVLRDNISELLSEETSLSNVRGK